MAGSLVFGALASDVVEMPINAAAANLTAYTMLLWCYPTTFTSNRILMAKGGGTNKALRLSGTAGEVQGVTLHNNAGGANTTIASTSTPLALNTRCFIAWAYDAAQSAGSIGRLYSGRVGTPATECTYSGSNVDGTLALNDDNAITGTVKIGNNSAFTSAFQGEIGYAAYFPGQLTLAQIQSWQLNPRAVIDTIVAHHYVELGIGGATAIEYAGGAVGTVTGATQGSNITGITSKVAANVALLASMGYSNAQAFSVKDSRLSINAARTVWQDAMAPGGTVNSRAQGVASAATNVPTIVSEGVVFDGVNDQFASGQDTRLVFDAATALHCLAIVKISGNGPVCGAAQDPTNAALYPIAYLQGASGVIKGFYNPTGAGTGSVAPNSSIATGSSIRPMLLGRYARDGGTTSGDDGWHFAVFGQQAHTIPKNTQATTVAGGLKEFFGGQGGAFASCTVYHQMWIAADITPAAMQAYYAFAAAEFGAVLDTSTATLGSFAVFTHSWGAGTQTTDPLTPSVGSGTTSFAHLVATTPTANGTLQSKFGLVSNKQWMGGCVSGRTFAAAQLQYAHESALLLDGFRTGPKIAIVLFWTNDERTSALTLAAMKTAAAAYYTLLHNEGWTVVLINAPPYGTGLAGNATGCYTGVTPSTTLHAEGTVMTGMNSELDAPTLTYYDRLIRLASLTGFRFSPRDCGDTSLWNTDETHPKDAGHVLIANLLASDFGVNALVWAAVLPRRAALSRLGSRSA